MNDNGKIDYKKLRRDLLDYYGTAMSSGFPQAIFDMENVEYASDSQLLRMAMDNNINVYNKTSNYSRKRKK